MMRTYQFVGWWSPQGSGSIGDMLNLGCWQWVLMEYHSYEFLEGHICVVAYCNVELTVCILFVVWDLYSNPGSVTDSFPSSGSGPSVHRSTSKNMTKIQIREIDIFIRIRKMFTNVHKHWNPKNTKHLQLSFLVQVRNFLLPFWV